MKNVLIICSSFRWGGINVALQNWLRNIDPKETVVDVFVTVHSGSYEHSFKNCTILPKSYFLDTLIDHASLKHGITKIISIAMKLINRVTSQSLQLFLYRKVGNRLVKRKHYDAVIGWHEGVPTSFVSFINHPNKSSWIHCDYANYTDKPCEREYYSRIEHIVCVSKYTRKTFLEFYPEFSYKTETIYNILDIDNLKYNALQKCTGDFVVDRFTIVSVGRVSPVKRFSLIPEIARKLRDRGCEFRWYIIGPLYPGSEQEKLIGDIEKYSVNDCVVLLGEKLNPYPYIAHANLLVSTSLSEALPFVISEAKALGVPVVSSDYGSAYELIDDNVGLISAIDSIDLKISEMIKNNCLYERCANNLRNFKYDNESILKKIDAIISSN